METPVEQKGIKLAQLDESQIIYAGSKVRLFALHVVLVDMQTESLLQVFQMLHGKQRIWIPISYLIMLSGKRMDLMDC